MTTVYIILCSLGAIYALVWVYLLTGHIGLQRRAVNAFLKSWENDEYTTSPATVFNRERIESCICIKFPDGESKRELKVDVNGKLTSSICWSDNSRHDVKPDFLTRRRLEPITEQIVTMAKLEGKLDQDGDAEGQASI